MLLIIPFSFVLLFIHFFVTSKNTFNSMTNSLLFGILYVIFITNLLSILRCITSLSVGIAWLIPCLILIIEISKKRTLIVEGFKQTALRAQRKKNRSFYGIIVFAILALISIVYARLTVPNNGDSMGYHLSRVIHWINNKSVEYYPVMDIRQLVSPVLDEYFLLHIMLLSGDDKYVNLLQSVSYVISAIYIFKISKMLGCRTEISFIGSILFMTVPITFAESVTTQNDLFATMVLWLFIYKCLCVLQKEDLSFNKKNAFDIVSLGLFFGIGYLAKTSVCIPMLYFSVCLIIYLLAKKRISVKQGSSYTILAAASCLIVILETIIRWKYYGSIDKHAVTGSVLVGTVNPAKLLVNLYKNMAILLVMPVFHTGFLERFGKMLAQLLHIDMNAREISFGKNDFSLGFSFHHDIASAYFITILGILIFLYFLAVNKNNRKKRNLPTIIFLGFLTIPIFLRWQPWGTRLMLPCVSLLSVLCALGIEDLCQKSAALVLLPKIVCAVCVVSFLPQVLLGFQYKDVKAALDRRNDRFSLYFHQGNIFVTEYDGYIPFIKYCESLQTDSMVLCATGCYTYPFLSNFWMNHNVAINEIILEENPLDVNIPVPDYIACINTSSVKEIVFKKNSYVEIWSETGEQNSYHVYKKVHSNNNEL